MRWVKNNIWLVCLGVLVAAGFIASFVSMRSSRPELTNKHVYPVCTSIADDDRPFECWYERYDAMVEAESPDAAIADLKKLSTTPGYAQTNCHQLTHVIGHAGYKKYKDLSKAFSHGGTHCASGYYHGVMEEVSQQLGREKILAQLNTICDTFENKKQYGIEHHDCTHGMGHGLMAINDNDVYGSLKDCDILEGLWQQNSCYGGVFMENIVGKLNIDTPSKYLKPEQPLFPCTDVEDSYKPECFTYQTTYALKIVNGDYAAVFTQCGTISAPLDSVCYQSLGRDVSANSVLNKTQILKLCQLGPSAYGRENCIIGAARDIMYITYMEDDGTSLCRAIEDSDGQARCLKILNDYAQLF